MEEGGSFVQEQALEHRLGYSPANVRPTLEQKMRNAVLGQKLGGPESGDTCPDDDDLLDVADEDGAGESEQ